MRDYVIINGVNSLTINGLAISKLPPISKPLMRNMKEEIDGRDGDIITELGYSAYDKEMEIGLYGNYDINEIISFFNGEGTITFSNESDKYYYFKILEQINYEKLLKFKTATITFHCQPFKYQNNEEKIDVDSLTVEGTGTDITLANTSLYTPISTELLGDTIQDGTPTPDAPVEVNTVTGNQSIKIEGKNLFNLTSISMSSGTAALENGEINLTWSGGFNLDLSNIVSNLINGTSYTISFKHKGNALYLRNRKAGSTNVLETNTDSDYTTYSITLNNITAFEFRFVRKDTTGTAYIKDIQIEKGSTASEDYYPYNSQTYPITLGNLELCKIGDYKDKIYKENGKWYLHKEIGKYVFTDNENWESLSYGTMSWRLRNVLSFNPIDSEILIISNIFKGIKKDDRSQEISNSIYVDNSTQFVLRNTSYSTISTIRDATKGKYVYYVLATPTTTEITDTELLAQLTLLSNATTYDEATNISSKGDLPSILNVSATSIPTTTITNIGNIYAKPLLTIKGSGDISVYLNGIQLLQIALGDREEITIDISKMEAYDEETKVLLNRLVIGDYSKFLINSGVNELLITGDVSNFTMSNYTRWL